MTRKMKKVVIPGWMSLSPLVKPRISIHPWHFHPSGSNNFSVEFDENLPLKKPAWGWCSYYAFAEDVTDKKIWSNVEVVSKNRKHLPLDYFVIDDGWCLWGDWDRPDKSRFPDGISGFGKRLANEGYKIALWISPYQVDPVSHIVKEHPDWILRQGNEPLVSFAFCKLFDRPVGKLRFALDYKNPQVKKHIRQTIDLFVAEWKIDMLKLDYLYAPFFDPTATLEQASAELVELLEHIKANYPKVYTVACGPFDLLAGRVDSAYVSENVILPVLRGWWPLNSVMHRIRLERLQQCLVARKELKGAFNFDPDVFACSEDLGLTDAQVEMLLAAVRESNGNRFLGDDLSKLPQARLEKYVYKLFAE